MPTVSKKGNVWKKCACKRQSTCAHPWHYYAGSGKNRRQGSLDKLLRKHAPDLTTAKEWAQRAILAVTTQRDPREVLAEDDPTIEQILTQYLASRGVAWNDRWQVPCLCRVTPTGRGKVGLWRVSGLTYAALEDVLRNYRPRLRADHDFSLLTAAFTWAVRRGLMESNPFYRGGVCLWQKQSQVQRRRRLAPGEYEALLAHAVDPDFADAFVALVETAVRSGELAAIQWAEVSETSIFLPAWKTKKKYDRSVPISDVLRLILERRLLDPAGKRHLPTAYVFGDAAGGQVLERKTAFLGAVLRAHGYPPHYIGQGADRKLDPKCRAAYKAIDLNIHDLRREACSRWVESGLPLPQIMSWSGHASLKQLSTYVAPAIGADPATMARYDELRRRYVESRKTEAHGSTFVAADVQNRPFTPRSTNENPRKTA